MVTPLRQRAQPITSPWFLTRPFLYYGPRPPPCAAVSAARRLPQRGHRRPLHAGSRSAGTGARRPLAPAARAQAPAARRTPHAARQAEQIGRASCRERV